MELVADRNNCGLIISSWARLADGKFGSIQRHGKFIYRISNQYTLDIID